MRYKPFASETELARAFQRVWDATPGHHSWPEVLGCDLVLFDGTRHLAVEAKLQFGIPVLEQAWKHRTHFNGTYILVPDLPPIAHHVCRGAGVGAFEMNFYGGVPTLRKTYHPVFDDAVTPVNLHLLNDDAKRWEEPGCPSPSGMSNWHARMLKLGRMATKVPGMTLTELLNMVEPRYHKKSQRLLGPKRQDYDYIMYTLRIGKCKTMRLNAKNEVEPTPWLIEFDAPKPDQALPSVTA